MSAAFEKKPKLVRFSYDELPLSERDLEDLLLIVRMLAIDRERALQIVLNTYVDVDEIRVAALKEGYYLGLRLPLDDFGVDHPLILESECLTIDEVEEVLREICGKGEFIETIPVVQEKLKDVTSQIYGED